jgi:hypothetical protein
MFALSKPAMQGEHVERLEAVPLSSCE